ncbi:MAG: NAD(P)H-dependent oxidoreductase subunit E [Candidatus Latescibacteria bacterium]|nr:NAD(P)H-dependent oxidoreductase subunit E [Candidatus Latescibacterota bacterium]
MTDLTAVDKVLQTHNHDKSMLVAILQDAQEQYRYLPKEVLTQISIKLEVPMSEIYQVVTFYKAFSLKPRGKHICSICMGTACHVRGAPLILETVKKHLDVEPGQNTKNMQFTLNTVNCVGACAVGPVVQVDNTLYGNLTSMKSIQLLKKFEKD